MSQFDKLPSVLIEYPQWVNYLLFPKADGKPTKLPVNPTTGRYASVSDPSTWASFDRAQERLAHDPRLKGLGFVFRERDPFTGFDFDHCRDPHTCVIDPDVAQWLALLDSYSENSVSGTGIHTLVTARLLHSGCRKGNIEMYDRRRFFVITGQHLEGTPFRIEDRQSQVDLLHSTLFPPKKTVVRSHNYTQPMADLDLHEKIVCSAVGDKYLRLMNGNWSGYPSQSEADLALCGILARWTRDDHQVDAIFRTSGLYREKWDERHHQSGLTYGQMTIAKARS